MEMRESRKEEGFKNKNHIHVFSKEHLLNETSVTFQTCWERVG